MQEELKKFEINEIRTLHDPPKNKVVIGAKLVFKNKLDEEGKVVRKKD